MSAIDVFPVVSTFSTALAIGLAVLASIVLAYLVTLCSSYIIQSNVDQSEDDDIIDHEQNAHAFVIFAASIWPVIVGAYNAARRILTALYLHITSHCVLYLTLTLALILVFPWQFASVQIWTAWASIRAVVVLTLRLLVLQVALIFKIVLETIYPLINYLIRIASALVTGTIFDGTTCSAQAVWETISTRFVNAALQLTLGFSDWLIQDISVAVQTVPDYAQFGRAFALSIGSFQVFFSCVCSSVSIITQPLFDGIAYGTYTSFENNPCPEVNAPVPDMSHTACAAEAAAQFPFAVVGDLLHPWVALADEGTFVSWYNAVNVNSTVDTAYSFVNCTAHIPDDIVRSYYYFFVDLALDDNDVICPDDASVLAVHVDGPPRIRVRTGDPEGLFYGVEWLEHDPESTALSFPGPPPAIFGCFAPYLWLGMPAIGGVPGIPLPIVSTLDVLIGSPEVWKLTVNALFQLNNAFSSWDGQLLWRLDSFYQLWLDLFQCLCDIILWIGDIMHLISVVLNEAAGGDIGACTGIGADDIVGGAFACVFELMNSALRLWCCIIETSAMWVIEVQQQIWKQLIGFLYTMVTNGAAMSQAVHPCSVGTIAPIWVNYCTAPKTSSWFLDYAQFEWGSRRWNKGVNYCDKDFCEDTLECRSDVDCRGLGDDSDRVCDTGFTNRCIYVETRGRPCPDATDDDDDGNSIGKQCLAPTTGEGVCAIGECLSTGECMLDEPTLQSCDCECPVNTVRRLFLLILQWIQCIEEFLIRIFGTIIQTITCFIMQALRVVVEAVLLVFDLIIHIDPIVKDPSGFNIDRATQPLILSVQGLILCATDGLCTASSNGNSCDNVQPTDLDDDIDTFLSNLSNGVDNLFNAILDFFVSLGEIIYDIYTSIKIGTTVDIGDNILDMFTSVTEGIGALLTLFGAIIEYAAGDLGEEIGGLIVDLGDLITESAADIVNGLVDFFVFIVRWLIAIIEAIFNLDLDPLLDLIADLFIWLLEATEEEFKCFIDGARCFFGLGLSFPAECSGAIGCVLACGLNDLGCFFGGSPLIPNVDCNDYLFCPDNSIFDIMICPINDAFCALQLGLGEEVIETQPGQCDYEICPDVLSVAALNIELTSTIFPLLDNDSQAHTTHGHCAATILEYASQTWPPAPEVISSHSIREQACIQLYHNAYRRATSTTNVHVNITSISYGASVAAKTAYAARDLFTTTVLKITDSRNGAFIDRLSVKMAKAKARKMAIIDARPPEVTRKIAEFKRRYTQLLSRFNEQATSLYTHLSAKRGPVAPTLTSIGELVVSSADNIYNDNTNYFSWGETLYNHRYLGRMFRLGSRRVLPERPQSHLDDDEQCDTFTSPFVCCPTQTVCTDCSFFDRAFWAGQDGAVLMTDYYTGDYRTRFVGCSSYLANTSHLTFIPAEIRCPAAVCALPECTRDDQCAEAAQDVPAFCNQQLGRCALAEEQCTVANTDGLCYVQAGNAATIGECAVLGGNPVCIPVTAVFRADCQCPDTYLTVNKRIPPLLTRFGMVQWPWLWDFAAFRERVDPDGLLGNSSDNPYRGTFVPAMTANGTEPNLGYDIVLVLNAIIDGLGDSLIDFAEDVRNLAASTSDNIDVALNVISELILCDYDDDYYARLASTDPQSEFAPCCSDRCENRRQGTSLFDGLLLASLLVGIPTLIGTLVPVFSICTPLIGALIVAFIWMPLVQAIAYGGGMLCYISGYTALIALVIYGVARLLNAILSVFCCGTIRTVLVTILTLLSLAAAILAPLPGASVALGPDAYQLVSELMSPCTFLPTELVDRTKLSSMAVCGALPTNVELPDLHDCLTTSRLDPTRFKDGIDTLLYIAEQLDEGFNARLAARTLNSRFAFIGKRALRHTTEAHAAAGPLADTCAWWTSPNLVTALFVLLLLLVALIFSGEIIAWLSLLIFPLMVGTMGAARVLLQEKRAVEDGLEEPDESSGAPKDKDV